MKKAKSTLRSKLHVLFLPILFLRLGSADVRAAPCCSSSGGMPTLLTGDDRAQVSVDVYGGYVVGDVPAHGEAIFRSDDELEIESGANVAWSILLSDRWQFGLQFPFRHRRIENSGATEAHSGMGDIRLSVAYEWLTEWSYSRWRPKSFVFLQQTFPLAPSVYDSSAPQGTDALGKGFYSSAAGLLFIKRFAEWDASWLMLGQFSFPRTFEDGLSITPGFGMQTALNVGLSPGNGPVRVGLRLGPSYQQPKSVSDSLGGRQTPYQLVWDAGIEVGLTLTAASSISANYTDQTLLGPTKNTSLSRVFLLGYQYRWQR